MCDLNFLLLFQIIFKNNNKCGYIRVKKMLNFFTILQIYINKTIKQNKKTIKSILKLNLTQFFVSYLNYA